MRYFISLAYNGTAYHGWQIQPNGISVQEVLTKALAVLLRHEVDIVGAGRTDTGVHARLMVAHFDADFQLPDKVEFIRRINSILPKDIAIIDIVRVKPDAHARFDALSRAYEYHLYIGKNVFKENAAMRLFHQPDFELMNEAADRLKDYRDFTSFSKLHTDVKTNNCVISYAHWEQRADEWVFCIRADRFLRNMVRSVVGTLLDVGMKKITVQDFCNIIEAKDRCRAGVSVPGCGLYLVDIQYPSEIFHVESSTNHNQ